MDTFTFGSFTVFENEKLKENREKLTSINGYARDYILDDSYDSNRTIVYKNGNDLLVFQIIINTSIFDVVVPTSKQLLFKDKIFGELLEYLIYMIRLQCANYYSVANEIEFKLNLYVENKTPASNATWWETNGENLHTKYKWENDKEHLMKTTLKKPFGTVHKRISMKLEFNTLFYVKCCSIKEKHLYTATSICSLRGRRCHKRNSRRKLESSNIPRDFYK